MSGTLYVVGTPIGNLGDITLRAVETLKMVDLIAAEDTRRTRQLLSHLQIHTELLSFHEHSTEGRVREIARRLADGQNVALVTDAGMPMISDPGYVLVRACRDESLPVTVVPGPTAASCAIALSAIDCRRYVFGGFLPAKSSARRKEFVTLWDTGLPVVLYESPARVVGLLEEIAEVIGPGTEVCAAREMTKVHEQVLRGTCAQVLKALREMETVRGEFVLVIGAKPALREIEDDEIREQLAELLARGLSNRDAARTASDMLGVSKKRAYSLLLGMDEKS